ncbi:hypothetical protein [Actinophytocola sp. NPDC049390]|uniref:hypothetical protein n=1 Tax=Actinophytocola sp. NPDC049390 TaxID=3363894 RepID=UPI0037A619BC
MPIHDARRLVAVSALTLLLAACTNEMAGSPIGTGQIVDEDPSASAPGPSGTGTPAPPSPTNEDIPPAADGSDVKACYDGTCEVMLRAPVKIPFDPKTGLVELNLTRVDGVDGAQLSGTAVGGGTVSVSVYADPGFESTATVNGFTITALYTVDGVAVLRMSPPS